MRVWAQLFKYEWILSKALNIHVLGFAWVDDLAVRSYIYQLPYLEEKKFGTEVSTVLNYFASFVFFFIIILRATKVWHNKNSKTNIFRRVFRSADAKICRFSNVM